MAASLSQVCPVPKSKALVFMRSHPDEATTEQSDSSSLASFIRALPETSTKNQLPVHIPSFLINTLDGQFTPYTDRTPARSLAEEGDNTHDTFSAVTISPSAATSSFRSPAASMAYQKLLDHQAQIMSGVSAGWKRRFSDEFIDPPQTNQLGPCKALQILPRTMLGRPHQPLRRLREHCTSAFAIERLPFCDGQSNVVDVPKWKSQNAERTKSSFVIAWLKSVTLADDTDDAEAPVDWPEPCVV